MKQAIALLLMQGLCVTASFGANSRFIASFTTHVPARSDLEVRWNAPTNKLPQSIWVYHLLPRKLSPEIISSLMVACSFTSKEATTNGDLLICRNSDGSRELRLSWPWGVIEYTTPEKFSVTNLVKDVPSTNEAVKLAEKLLPELGINIADLVKRENSSAPEFHPSEWGRTYFIGTNAIQNTEACEVRFRRVIDGLEFISLGTGGDGEIKFGSHGEVTWILITWRNIERSKLYATLAPEKMIQSIREGKAIQGGVPMKFGDIDWRTVKSVTIHTVKACYFAGYDPFAPSDWLEPYAALWTTVVTDHGSVDVGIDCPIIDENQPVERQ